MESCRKGFHNGFRGRWVIICLCSVLVSGGLAYGATGGLTCSGCHGMPPHDSASGRREPATGAFKGNHETHAGTTAESCARCHGSTILSYGSNHLDGTIAVPTRLNNWSGASYSRPVFFNQTSLPPATLGTCSTTNCHFEAPTPPWGAGRFASPGDCNRCHGIAPETGSHSRHAGYYGNGVESCVRCHVDHTLEGSAAFQHATSAGARGISVRFAAPPNTGGTYSGDGKDYLPSQEKTTFGSCSNIYCHSAGQGIAGGALAPADYGTPEWGRSVDCGSCHKDMATTTATSGSHYTHANTSQGGYDCSICHGGGYGNATVPRTNGSTHVNGRINLDFTAGAGGTVYSKYSSSGFAPAKGAYGNCSNAVCHADVYGSGTVPTPVWGTSAGCSACHTAAMGASGPATGSHANHMAIAGVGCTACHAAGTTATTAPATGHNDGNIDTAVGAYPTNLPKHAAGSGYASASCSTSSCHGTAAKTWGANTANGSCTKCHGQGVSLGNYSTARAWQAAPGYATTGTDVAGQTGAFTNGVSSDPQVGAHDAHLRLVNGYTDRRIVCTDCHSIPTSANHANGTTDYAWSNLARNVGTSLGARGALIPGYTGGSCSTNYCHGGVLNGGSTPSPVWNDTSFLSSYAKNETTCSRCHGAPPTSGATLNYRHAGVTIATSCTSCHGHEGKGPDHIDGILQASGGSCDTCHSYDTVGGAWGTGSHLDGAVAEGWGAHARHIDHLKTLRGITLNATTDTYGSNAFNAICGVCHTRSAANHTLDNSSARFITFSSAYQTGPDAPVYLGVSGTPSSANPKTCSNLSCHFNASPRWQ